MNKIPDIDKTRESSINNKQIIPNLSKIQQISIKYNEKNYEKYNKEILSQMQKNLAYCIENIKQSSKKGEFATFCYMPISIGSLKKKGYDIYYPRDPVGDFTELEQSRIVVGWQKKWFC